LRFGGVQKAQGPGPRQTTSQELSKEPSLDPFGVREGSRLDDLAQKVTYERALGRIGDTVGSRASATMRLTSKAGVCLLLVVLLVAAASSPHLVACQSPPKPSEEALSQQQQQQQEQDKKAAVEETPARKTPARKTPVKKTPARKTPAKKRTGGENVLFKFVFETKGKNIMFDAGSIKRFSTMATDFLQSGFSPSPPCSSAILAATSNCAWEIDTLGDDMLAVRGSINLLAEALLEGGVPREVLFEEMRRQLSVASIEPKKAVSSFSDRSTEVVGSMGPEVVQAGPGSVVLGVSEDPEGLNGPGIAGVGQEATDDVAALAAVGIDLGRRLREAMVYMMREEGRDLVIPDLGVLVSGYVYPGENVVTPDIYDLIAASASVREACCSSVNTLLRYSTCLCDKGPLGIFLKSSWGEVDPKSRAAFKSISEAKCKGIITLPANFQSMDSLGELDETKVCKCKTLLERLEGEARRAMGDQQTSMPSPMQGIQPLDAPLRFESLASARSFFTEQRIDNTGGGDDETARLIRETCT